MNRIGTLQVLFEAFPHLFEYFQTRVFAKKCPISFAAPIVRVSQNMKIFQNEKQYTVKLKFVWNAASDLKMQDENSVKKLHVVFGLVAAEK